MLVLQLFLGPEPDPDPPVFYRYPASVPLRKTSTYQPCRDGIWLSFDLLRNIGSGAGSGSLVVAGSGFRLGGGVPLRVGA